MTLKKPKNNQKPTTRRRAIELLTSGAQTACVAATSIPQFHTGLCFFVFLFFFFGYSRKGRCLPAQLVSQLDVCCWSAALAAYSKQLKCLSVDSDFGRKNHKIRKMKATKMLHEKKYRCHCRQSFQHFRYTYTSMCMRVSCMQYFLGSTTLCALSLYASLCFHVFPSLVYGLINCRLRLKISADFASLDTRSNAIKQRTQLYAQQAAFALSSLMWFTGILGIFLANASKSIL